MTMAHRAAEQEETDVVMKQRAREITVQDYLTKQAKQSAALMMESHLAVVQGNYFKPH